MRDTILRINSIANWKNLFIAVLVAALVACGGSGGSSSGTSSSPIYTMVFDAGSSGTRINFYKVIPGAGGYPQVTLLDNQKFNDNGINDFLNGTGTIDPSTWTKDATTGLPINYTASGCNMTASTTNGGSADVWPCVIQPLLDSMAAKMAEYGVTASQVKVELFATAGMRTMSQFNGGNKDDTTIANFYGDMKQKTQDKGFAVGDFTTSNGNSQEGLWTWVNLNDLYYNAFGGNTGTGLYYSGAPTARGDFEVGGSSMQIAFPTTIAPSDANNVYTVKINGYTYNVFSKTYLGLGGDDARKFVRAYGFSSGNGGADCFGTNATSSNTAEDSGVTLFRTSGIFTPDFFPNSTTPDNNVGTSWTQILFNSGVGSSANPLVLFGSPSFNSASCSGKYNDVTTSVMALPRNNYGTTNQGATASYSDLITKVATSTAPFVGLDGFYYASQGLGLVPSGQLKTNFTQSQFATALTSTCPTGGAGPSGTKIRQLAVCANSIYMQNMLWKTGGLFTSGTGATFEGVVPSDVGSTAALTWTRGYLLLKYAN